MTKKLDSLTSDTGAAPPAHGQPVGAPQPKHGHNSSTPLYRDDDKSSVANALFGSSGTLDHPALSDSSGGRAAIRLVSRGIVGAAAFTFGGQIVKNQMKGYDTYLKFAELKLHNPLQIVAWGIDHGIGKPIQAMTHFLTPGDAKKKANAAWDVVRFRTKMFNQPAGKNPLTTYRGFEQALNGRGLGAEMVAVTFDFFLASIGDAATRNVFQALDPNVRQPWIVDANGKATVRGKGHFDAGKWAQSLGRSSWRILSKNAGEDWAAALPYVYQMKWQRQAISKLSSGFKINADNGLNGAIARVDANGQIVGGYQREGALDLHCRFVGYNWYTLMYREGYDTVTRNFKRWKDDGYKIHAPHIDNPLTAAVDAIGFSARYVAKSFIKANLYMQPAVLFFWPMRVSQSKWRGMYVAEQAVKAKPGAEFSFENAILSTKPNPLEVSGPATDPRFLGDATAHSFKRALLIHGRSSHFEDPRMYRDVAHWGNGRKIERGIDPNDKNNIFNITHPYEWGAKRSAFDAVLNVFGYTSYQAGSGLTHLVDRLFTDKHGVIHADPITKMLNPSNAKIGNRHGMLLERERALRSFVDNSLAYTPYMWAKAETALRVDDRRNTEDLGHMDKAIYRFIDSAVAFDGRGVKKATGDIIHLSMNIEKDVKSREGAPVADGTTIPRADYAALPQTKVSASSISRHVPAEGYTRIEHAGERRSEQQMGRRWADQQMDRKIEAQQSSQNTIH